MHSVADRDINQKPRLLKATANLAAVETAVNDTKAVSHKTKDASSQEGSRYYYFKNISNISKIFQKQLKINCFHIRYNKNNTIYITVPDTETYNLKIS